MALELRCPRAWARLPQPEVSRAFIGESLWMTGADEQARNYLGTGN